MSENKNQIDFHEENQKKDFHEENQIDFHEENQKKDFHEENQKKDFHEEYWDDAKTKPKFVIEVWDNGSLKYLDNLNADGQLHGLSRWFNENGTINTEINYKNDKKHGLMSMWYAGENKNSGNKWFEYKYKEGKLHGSYLMYYENGQTMIEGNYKNGERYGKFNYYDDNGDKCEPQIL